MREFRISCAAAAVSLILVVCAARSASPQVPPTISSDASRDEYLRLLIAQAEAGDPAAQDRLAFKYLSGEGVPKDIQKALHWYQKGAEGGDPDAQYNLGAMYASGEGVEANQMIASKWFQKAADQGHTMAMNNLGARYVRGLGVLPDVEKAFSWYKKAAELGEPLAMTNLGNAYRIGQGTAVDYELAVRWFRAAADLEEPAGQAFLGTVYLNGDYGVTRDPAKGFELLLKSARQGYCEAAYQVATMYRDGKDAPRDRVEALMWLIVADARKQFLDERIPEDYFAAAQALRDQMPSEEIVKAEERAKALLASLPAWNKLG